jgi:hypothetical protein
MGCIGSRLAITRNRSFTRSRRSSRAQNIFPVLNVDDMGRQISPGKLEVTETDLVLHVRGKPSLTWPLRCLRRYGFDNDLFSFESGRRCPTGAGIFAFRCTRAQSLFNLLQLKIQANPGATPNTVPSTPITPSNVCGNNPSTPVSSTFVYVNLAENSTNRQSTNNAPDVCQVSGSLQHNQAVPSSADSIVGGCGSSFPTSYIKPSNSSQLQDNSHPVYMNVESASSSTFTNYQNHGNASSRYGSVGGKHSQNVPAACHSVTSKSNLPSLHQHVNHKLQHQRSLEGHSSSKNFSYGRNQETTTITNDLLLYTNVICSPSSDLIGGIKSGSEFVTACHESSEVNYAELDLKTDTCSCSVTTTSTFTTTSGTNSSSSSKGRLFFLSNKENNWPSAGGNQRDSKMNKLKSDKLMMMSGGGCVGDGSVVSSNEFMLQNNLRQNDGSEISSSKSESANMGYATIDFDRTAALSVVTRSKINLDFHASSTPDEHDGSVRKTRHNSTAL